MKPYVLISPPYDPVSGGIKVMYGLYGHLLARGIEVYMGARPEGEVIAIYPEIVNGNPAQANTVVRYILNKPGVMTNGVDAGPTSFDPSERLYYFSRLFGDTDNDHYMFLPIINLNIFKDQNKKRTKNAVFVGKGRDLRLHPRDCVWIDRGLSRNQQWLADTLNECEVMYQYDPVSAMSEVSRLCGCRVVMMDNHYSRKDYEEKYEPGVNGIGWNKQVPLETEAFREHYIGMKKTFEGQLDKFIEATQK